MTVLSVACASKRLRLSLVARFGFGGSNDEAKTQRNSKYINQDYSSFPGPLQINKPIPTGILITCDVQELRLPDNRPVGHML